MTAQASLFQTKESKKQARRAELIAKALSFWATYAEAYRSLPYKYFFCLSEKQRLGLSRNKLPLTEEDWPKVPLFYIEDFETAKGWLDQKTTSELHYLVEVLEEVVNLGKRCNISHYSYYQGQK